MKNLRLWKPIVSLAHKSLPNQIYSQSLIKVMREKIDFFKSNSGMNSIDYNASSGQLTIINEKQKIIYQRDDPGIYRQGDGNLSA